MSAPPENFETLQRLLKLKRHEQPPPRYFHEFSGHVLSRIRAEQRQRISLWERLGLSALFRPGLAAAGGIMACGLILYGVAFAFSGDATTIPVAPIGDRAAVMPAAMNPVAKLEAQNVGNVNSTEPVASAPLSFSAPLRLDVERASYQPR